METDFDVVVAGCGVAGLSAAMAAAEAGARVVVLERAPFAERGGQTRYTEAYFRMKSANEVSSDFTEHLAENSSGYLDPSLLQETLRQRDQWPSVVRGLGYVDHEVIDMFASAAAPTVAWLQKHGVRFDALPTQFITSSQPRLLPVGGGLALVEALAGALERAGATILYETTAVGLLQDDAGRVCGLRATARGHKPLQLRASGGVVLACGGFEGSTEMLTRYLGPRSTYLRPVCRGANFNKGEGIQMALDIGAAPCGDFGSYHAEPIDPRSGIAEPSVFVFPYGVLVNREGQRFVDEAPGTVDQYYERVTRRIYEQTEGLAWVILDAGIDDVPNWRVGLRTDQPPIVADSIADLAVKLSVPATALTQTIERYNAACMGDRPFQPLRVDALATQGLVPPKSNWARPIDKPPFHAYPIISSNVFTFGGLKVDPQARVLDKDGDVIEGLYAAGEVVGMYYRNYTGATSVLKGAVFGRVGGAHAAARRVG